MSFCLREIVAAHLRNFSYTTKGMKVVKIDLCEVLGERGTT